MNKPKFQPVSLVELNQKLNDEAKRLVREKEGGIAKLVSKKANLKGNSTLIFKKKDGTEVILSFRLNENGNLRFAYDKKYFNK
ncbi:MAG: hypothetical protein A3E61_00175 [Candidatus Colwellbacteria bacterium RIFCSPHIGHO2_12_FULL_43_12]|uniref:Uncharacterized protein n=3 Tax=Candidatus Colwelliibacteriota TaxID=1817904 RepID=A0A1G1Z187_9BACT|nr:MAG: hypothetical protein A3D47_02480 [Candidatus Colwellbacteria bacterium RIFCSPHIGHO2_02_FULL_43_15]OGY58459.1 MAG: hypothetical protein A3E61_00175 [Candidatus Colwellbacteria bacterium RIFCSPHIGHO2_12_FULL_43_12]OGY61170.1 MAG: hypothetical protein A3F99_00730 [Candidatus Colwellbacteria bacterium RIFCSPLOWO2_12_FULL_43_11]